MIFIERLILGFVLGIFIAKVCELWALRKLKRPKVYYLKPDIDQWLDITKNPIPLRDDDYFEGRFIVSDGNIVSAQFIQQYNSKGQLIMNISNKVITHWMPLPEPPKG